MTVTDRATEASLRARIAERPRPAVAWVAVFLALVALEAGAVLDAALGFAQGTAAAWPSGNPAAARIESARAVAEAVPTLLSRETVPNQGWRTSANGPWASTALGLAPKGAWLVRLLLTFAYAVALAGWVGYGYRIYRARYRRADWTPTDDVVRRFRGHAWGKFGLAVVFAFVVLAAFAPTLSPTTADRNIESPYEFQTKYFDEATGSVETVYVGEANGESASRGAGDANVGLWQYDDFGRFHPFGTMPSGADLFTFVAYGARVTLVIGLVAMGVMCTLATAFAMVTAYYKGAVDLGVVLVGDSVMAVPQLLLLILVTAVFDGHWLEGIYDGGLLVALVFGLTGWPALWRAIRGPAFRASTEAWVDAARSYGQRPAATMRKHVFPSVVGYLLVYASMTLGGVVVGTAALSFLGIGVDAPTPEWGRAVSLGRPYVATQSWHVAVIPGVLVVLLVTACNALGDGIRDAIDPRSGSGEADAGVAAGGGGG